MAHCLTRGIRTTSKMQAGVSSFASACVTYFVKLVKTSLTVLNEALEKTGNRINRFYRGKGEGRGRGGELSDSDENMT